MNKIKNRESSKNNNKKIAKYKWSVRGFNVIPSVQTKVGAQGGKRRGREKGRERRKKKKKKKEGTSSWSAYWSRELISKISSVAQSCLTLCDPVDCSTPGLPVHHHLPELTETHVHWVRDAIQPSHPRSSPSPPAPNPSQHQSLFQWVNSSHEVAKVLELQL